MQPEVSAAVTLKQFFVPLSHLNHQERRDTITCHDTMEPYSGLSSAVFRHPRSEMMGRARTSK